MTERAIKKRSKKFIPKLKQIRLKAITLQKASEYRNIGILGFNTKPSFKLFVIPPYVSCRKIVHVNM